MLTIELDRQTGHREAVAPAALEVEIEVASSSIVFVKLSGQAGANQVDDIEQQLESAVRQGPRFVILDLAGLTFISPAALRGLVEFRRQRCWQGSEVLLAGLQPCVWLAVQAAGLDRLFPIRASVAEFFAS
jgi:anti-anti-sigma factor